MPETIKSAVIAAAGQATRMWPASKVIPKEIFPLGKVPVIVHLIWELTDAGIENIVIVGGAHNRPILEALFDPAQAPPVKLADDPLVKRFQRTLHTCKITIIEQGAGYGNGIPLYEGAETFGNAPCVYAFGDDIIVGENATRGMLDLYQRTGNPAMGAQEVPPERTEKFGIVESTERDGIAYIDRVLEKPKLGTTPSRLAAFGRYIATPELLAHLRQTKPGKDGEIWLVDAFLAHLASGGEACAFTLDQGTWHTVGDPEGYAAAVRAVVDEHSAE